MTLPTYEFDESEMSQLVKLLYTIVDDIGLSPAQCTNRAAMYKGDFFAVQNIRFGPIPTIPLNIAREAQFHQSENPEHAPLRYIETGAGFFHLEMAILSLIFRSHLGEVKDLCSLEFWMSKLGKVWGNYWYFQFCDSITRDPTRYNDIPEEMSVHSELKIFGSMQFGVHGPQSLQVHGSQRSEECIPAMRQL